MPGYLSRGLRNGGAPYVADLAVILVKRVGVPVRDRVRRKGHDCQHCRNSQQPICDSFRHGQLN